MKALALFAGLAAVFFAASIPGTVATSEGGDAAAVVEATTSEPGEQNVQQDLVRQEVSSTPLAKKQSNLLPVLIGVAVLALLSMVGSRSYIIQKLKEDKRVQELLEKYIDHVYATLKDTYIIDDKLTPDEIQKTAKQFKDDILKEEKQIETLVRARRVEEGSIPIHSMAQAVKESLMGQSKMHPKVEQKGPSSMGLRYLDGNVEGIKEQIERHLHLYYEVADSDEYHPLVRLSPEEVENLVSEMTAEIQEKVKSQEDCLDAQMDLAVEVRRRVNQKQPFETSGKPRQVPDMVDGPIPKYDEKKAGEVFEALFFRWKEEKADEYTVKEIPQGLWKQMVREFMTMFNAQAHFEAECLESGRDFSEVTSQAMVRQIATSVLFQCDLITRKPIKPKGQMMPEVLDMSDSSPSGSK